MYFSLKAGGFSAYRMSLLSYEEQTDRQSLQMVVSQSWNLNTINQSQ